MHAAARSERSGASAAAPGGGTAVPGAPGGRCRCDRRRGRSVRPAGFTYAGARFSRYFGDFEAAYGFHDMYTGGFYPYRTPEERWAYWSRYIWVNRYLDPPEPVYRNLLELVQDKEYFVLTTNVDHCFQKAGFEKERFFTPRGTTACSSARNPAAVRPGTTGRASAGCWRNSADCASPQNGSPGVPDAADLRP